MFDVIARRRALKETEQRVGAALTTRGITDYATTHFDATYNQGDVTIVLSGRYLYHLATDGRLLELYTHQGEHLEPEQFATLLDGLFAELEDDPFIENARQEARQ